MSEIFTIVATYFSFIVMSQEAWVVTAFQGFSNDQIRKTVVGTKSVKDEFVRFAMECLNKKGRLYEPWRDEAWQNYQETIWGRRPMHPDRLRSIYAIRVTKSGTRVDCRNAFGRDRPWSQALCRSLSPNNAVTSTISFLLYCVTRLLQRQLNTRDQITLIKTNELNNSRITGVRLVTVARPFQKQENQRKKWKRGTLIFLVSRGIRWRLSQHPIDLHFS